MKAAFAFLTVLGRAAPPQPGAVAWFPVVGAVVGAGVGLVWWGAGEWWSPPVAAALAVTADLVLTGMLHLDGLADAADGLLPPLPRERRPEVMAAPDTGAFALGTVAVVLLLRFAALASVARPTGREVAAVAAVWATTRAWMAVTMATAPYVGRGAAVGFAGTRSMVALLTFPFALLVHGGAVVASLVAFEAVVWFARRRIGGFSGDVLGAAGMVGETAGLLALAT
jgi:adenosylcobinamide-GDP ribazoletransferase